jgi:hypothetical protein
MDNITIPLDGIDTKIILKKINTGQLILDEQNPRISFYRDNQVTDKLTGDQIIFALTNKKPEAFRKLKDSIHNNKGIMQAIWIEPIEGGNYRIVEGNSRFVVYKQLQEEEPNDCSVSEPMRQKRG